MREFLGEDKLCLQDLQAFHEWLDREKAFDLDLLRNVAYLTEEVGEVVGAIRDLKRADGISAAEAARAHLGEELADCLAYILKLANYAGVDLQEAYVRKMECNLDRTWYKKSEPKPSRGK
ncbi:MAG: MazG-like family protein [Chloroflexota bacterium]|nr:MazG-like family protein [Chloroflexota bacterium]